MTDDWPPGDLNSWGAETDRDDLVKTPGERLEEVEMEESTLMPPPLPPPLLPPSKEEEEGASKEQGKKKTAAALRLPGVKREGIQHQRTRALRWLPSPHPCRRVSSLSKGRSGMEGFQPDPTDLSRPPSPTETWSIVVGRRERKGKKTIGKGEPGSRSRPQPMTRWAKARGPRTKSRTPLPPKGLKSLGKGRKRRRENPELPIPTW